MKGGEVVAQARREIAREKVRILGLKKKAPSLLEKASLAWKEKKEAGEREKKMDRLQIESEQSYGFRRFVAQKSAHSSKQKSFDEIGWKQVKPSQKEGKKKREISLNTSTVRALAKKLISREWARALGKPQNLEIDSIEKDAASWKKKKDEEERRKKELELKVDKQRKILNEALYLFGQKLRQEKSILVPEEAVSLLEDKLEGVGEVLDIVWHKQGCYIWLEPWEEKKMRRISGDTLPVVYKVKVGQKLDIASYKQVDKENIRNKMREVMLYKPLQRFLINDEEDAEKVLEEVLFRIGRIIDIKRTEKGWDVSFEPWERVRKRNIENNGKGPVESDQIGINWSEGKFSFVPK